MSEYLKRVAEINNDTQQRTAFQSTGSQVVLAGPGSGKTYLLTTKIAQTLLDDTVRYPQKIACITFSRQLAGGLRKELSKLGVYDEERIFVGTVHSFCIAGIIMPVAAVQLRGRIPTPFRIASRQDKFNALGNALEKQGFQLPQGEWEQRNIQSNLDKFRRLHFGYQDGFDSISFPEADGYSHDTLQNLDWSSLAHDYSNNLAGNTNGSVDFVDIEMLALQTVQSETASMTLSAAYPWWFVDEYQDLSPLFHQLVDGLVASSKVSVFAIGDPNQCIYEELHGSQPHFLEALANSVYQANGTDVVTLKMNYRSVQDIIDLGDYVLEKPTGYQSSRDNPGTCHAIELDPSQITAAIRKILDRLVGTSPNTSDIRIAVLSPNRSALKRVLGDLESTSEWSVGIDKDPDYTAYLELTDWVRNLARWCSGDEIYFHELIPIWERLLHVKRGALDEVQQDDMQRRLFEVLSSLRYENLLVLDWLRSLVTELEFHSLLPPYERMQPDDVEELRKLYAAARDSGRLRRQTIRQFAQISAQVFLTTLHSSKGLEFDAAVIIDLDQIRESPICPQLKRRLAYVAVTRAKSILYVLIPHPSLPFANKLAGQADKTLKYWVLKTSGAVERKYADTARS